MHASTVTMLGGNAPVSSISLAKVDEYWKNWAAEVQEESSPHALVGGTVSFQEESLPLSSSLDGLLSIDLVTYLTFLDFTPGIYYFSANASRWNEKWEIICHPRYSSCFPALGWWNFTNPRNVPSKPRNTSTGGKTVPPPPGHSPDTDES